MLRIKVFSVGNKVPAWVKIGVQEYTARLSSEINLEWNQLKFQKKVRSKPAAIARKQEGEKLLASIPAGFKVVALDEGGHAWSSRRLASILNDWAIDSGRVCILIGGPDGLSEECLVRADQVWSLGPITLPHTLVKIILAEQLYRAHSINQRHPYHR